MKRERKRLHPVNDVLINCFYLKKIDGKWYIASGECLQRAENVDKAFRRLGDGPHFVRHKALEIAQELASRHGANCGVLEW